jgi:hypothetical protein
MVVVACFRAPSKMAASQKVRRISIIPSNVLLTSGLTAVVEAIGSGDGALGQGLGGKPGVLLDRYEQPDDRRLGKREQGDQRDVDSTPDQDDA